MTFKEKWLRDHPGEEFKIFGAKEGEWNCPYKNGYEDAPNADAHCTQSCMDCWNREMPGNSNVTLLPYKPGDVGYGTIKDSGERRQFGTGAVRDIQEGKGRCDLMPLEVIGKYFKKPIFGLLGMFLKDCNTAHVYECIRLFSSYYGEETNTTTDCTMFLEVAKHFEEGAKKYGENNWQKGLPVHCYIDSAVRHYLKWLRGDKDEPHDRAFVWNLICCIWEVDFSPRAKVKEMPVAEEKSYTCKLIPVTGDADLVRLGDYAGGMFEFADTAYAKVKLEYELENNVLCIDVLTGGVHAYNPDILVKPLDIWKVDGETDE